MIPATVFYLFVTIVPSARGVIAAFTDWDGFSSEQTWVGWANFAAILDDQVAKDAIVHTVLIALCVTVVQNVIGLLLALGVSSRIKSGRALRVVFFAPAVVTPLITAYVWKFMYAPNGAIAAALQAVGADVTVSWLGDYRLALWSVMIVIVWQFAGYSMVIFLAGLESIPNEVVEAAAVDGAGALRTFWSVKLPLLGPALAVNLLLSLIAGLKQFDVVWVMTGGGPGTATHTLSTLIFQNAFTFGQYGYSIALAVLLTVIALPVSALQVRMNRAREVG
ncbi:MAG: sugar ABC transporter permease [Propionicimonas sp.]